MKGVFELAVVASSLVGMMSAVQVATFQVRSRLVSALEMTEIVTGGLAITLLSFFLWSPIDFSRAEIHLFRFWIQLQAPLAISVASAFLLAKRRENAVVESLDDLLSRLMMRMKEGRSLAIALELVAGESRPTLRPRWLEIARSVSFSPQDFAQKSEPTSLKSVRLIEIAREFQRIDALNRSQLAELERWRLRVRTERSFRRKSVQATAQVRAQSLVLGVIYILLALFSVSAFGWSATRGPLQISFPLFLAGVFWIWRGGRTVKWSV